MSVVICYKEDPEAFSLVIAKRNLINNLQEGNAFARFNDAREQVFYLALWSCLTGNPIPSEFSEPIQIVLETTESMKHF